MKFISRLEKTVLQDGVNPTCESLEERRSVLRGFRVLSMIGLSLLLGLSACSSDKSGDQAAPGDETNTEQSGENESVAWVDATFEEALEMAKKADKMLLVDVWSDHCAQCGIMDQEIWETAEGAELAGDVIAVKVPSDAPDSYSFRNTYPITGLPAILLLDSGGNEIDRIVGYQNRDRFLSEAYLMMAGLDPIPDLKAAIAADPENAALYVPLLEKYLNRTNESDASKIKKKILELDPDNAGGYAEKAMREMARYYAFFHMDAEGSATIYKSIVEMFPDASSLNSALKATYEQSQKTGRVDEWVEWVCEQTNRNPDNGRLNSSVAMYAFRKKLHDSCLAEAARRAASLGAGPAGIDTVAVSLESR